MTTRPIEIPAEVIKHLIQLQAHGTPLASMVTYLAEAGLPKPIATVALCRAKVASLKDARQATHFSSEYVSRRAADEDFQQAVFDAWQADASEDHSASAA